MIKGIIFDFDGTLFDSMGIWLKVGGLYLQSKGKTAEKGLWDKIKNMSMLQAAAYLKETYGIPLTEEEIVDGINKIIEDFYFYEAMPKDNVVSVLSDLKKKGIKMCIATATDRHLVEAALKRCGMLDFFTTNVPDGGRADEQACMHSNARQNGASLPDPENPGSAGNAGQDCICSDSSQTAAGRNLIFTCTEVGHGKDEPDIYEAGRRAMGTEKSETAVFEDAYYAVKTAKNAGFFVAGVYDRYEKQTEEIKKFADAYIENFSDLEGRKFYI